MRSILQVLDHFFGYHSQHIKIFETNILVYFLKLPLELSSNYKYKIYNIQNTKYTIFFVSKLLIWELKKQANQF